MELRSDAIVLRWTNYSDRRAIVTLLTREAGQLAVSVADGPSRSSRRLRALLMPGSRIATVIDLQQSRQIHTLREATPLPPAIPANPTTTILSLFVCDLANLITAQSPPDPLIHDFIANTIIAIASTPHPANAAIAFMIGITRFIGIMPDLSAWHPGWVFDITGGEFRQMPPATGRWLSPADSAMAHDLMRINFRNMHHFHLSQSDRRTILRHIIDYYSLHFGAMSRLKSLDVLQAIFDQ